MRILEKQRNGSVKIVVDVIIQSFVQTRHKFTQNLKYLHTKLLQ